MATIFIAVACLALVGVLYYRYKQRRLLKKIQKELLELLDEQNDDDDE